MSTCLRSLGLVLLAFLMGCADFKKEEEAFCQRNPKSCGRPVPPTTLPRLAFPQSPLTVTARECTQVTLRVNDGEGSAWAVESNQAVSLAANPVAGFTLSSTSDCGDSVTQVAIEAGQSSATFYAKGTVPGDVTVTATAEGFGSGALAVTVSPAPPSQLALTVPASVDAGTCSSGTVQVKDANDFDTRVTEPTPVTLRAAPAFGIAFYSDAACTTPATSVILGSGESSAAFHFLGQIAASVTVTASATGLTEAAQSVSVTPGTGNQLVFTSTPRVVEAGACSQAVQVQSQDAQGNPAPAAAATQIQLQADPDVGLLFYSDSMCNTPATSVTLAAGTSTASFYFRGTRAGSVTVAATATGYTGSTQVQTINPGPPSVLVFTGPTSAQAGSCSAFTVELRDAHGNPTTTGSDRQVNLTATGGVTFFSNSGCSNSVTIVTILKDSGSASFFVRSNQAGDATLTGKHSGLTDATHLLAILAGPATALVFSGTTPAATVLAGACTLRRVESRDVHGNPGSSPVTVNLSASPQAEFFLDANCTSPAIQVSIPNKMSSADFYFKGIKGGINATATLDLTVSATGLTPATQTENIIPTVRSGSCDIPAGTTTSSTCTITPALADMDKTFLVFQATNADSSSGAANVRCSLGSTSLVSCERGGSTGGVVNIQWSVAEFFSGMAVQRKPVACGSTTTNVTVFPAVDPAQTFLLLSSQRNNTNQNAEVPRLAELTSTTAAEIWKRGNCNGGDANHLQVVSYTGASVQRGRSSLSGGTSSRQVTLSSAVALDRSILLYSYTSDGTGSDICERTLRGELISDGAQVLFSRGEGNTANCAGSQIDDLSWEVVEFPAGTFVQQVTQHLAAGIASVPITLPTTVDASRTVVFVGGQGASGQALGEGQYNAGEIIGEMRARAELSADGTTVTLTRDSSIASAKFTFFVVQLKP